MTIFVRAIFNREYELKQWYEKTKIGGLAVTTTIQEDDMKTQNLIMIATLIATLTTVACGGVEPTELNELTSTPSSSPQTLPTPAKKQILARVITTPVQAYCATSPYAPPMAVCVNGDGTPCDDGNACTKDDVCDKGVCRGLEDAYCTACQSDADCCGPFFCNPLGALTLTGKCSNGRCETAGYSTCPTGTVCTDKDGPNVAIMDVCE
ncbi:MAG: hypothetical protein ABIH87_04860 [bacterium]